MNVMPAWMTKKASNDGAGDSTPAETIAAAREQFQKTLKTKEKRIQNIQREQAKEEALAQKEAEEKARTAAKRRAAALARAKQEQVRVCHVYLSLSLLRLSLSLETLSLS